MTKPIIALDIDDVLSHTAGEILAFGNQRWGYNHTLDDFSESLPILWQVDHDEAEARWQEYMDSGTMSTYAVIPEALAAIKQLRKDFKIVAVTARRDVLQQVTKQWLDANYPGVIDELVMAGILGTGNKQAYKLTKAEVLKRIGADYLIDDQPKHCIGAAEVGVQALIFGDYPWNRDVELPESVVRCKDWAAVLEYFQE